MLVFPIFWAFLGWLLVVHLGLEGLGVFVFLVFAFFCCVAFVSVLFALLLVLWLDVVVLFFLFVFLFCFFGGFKGQVRWPKGPPHLALNPPYFLFSFLCSPFLFSFLFICFFCFLFLLFFVFFGGFKGQVRWPKGPPHLALNPPHFICFCFFLFFLCFLFLVFAFAGKKTLFSPKKGIFCVFFLCLPLFLFSLC